MTGFIFTTPNLPLRKGGNTHRCVKCSGLIYIDIVHIHNITPHIIPQFECGEYLGILCRVMPIPPNIVMDLNNVMYSNDNKHPSYLMMYVSVINPWR